MNFTVAIVGRPNVGKSTLFNRIIGRRISIVADKPGITRDRIYGESEWNGKKFTIIDTGGLEPKSNDIIFAQMKNQVDFAIQNADLILFMVDGKQGLTPTDEEIATILRRCGKKVLLVVNKIDNFENIHDYYEFYKLGYDDITYISASHGRATGDLLDKITDYIPTDSVYSQEEDIIKIAVVGRPNVGKSSIVNAILGENRVIVSDIPGTTRDAVDTYFEADNKKMVFIDTAGLRRKSRVKEDIEYYSNIRAISAMERADIVLMVLDASLGIAEQDKKIAGIAHDAGKAAVFVVNKWDMIDKDRNTADKYIKTIRDEFKFMDYAPILFVSAKTGQRIPRILDMIETIIENYSFRVKTSILNELIRDSIAIVEPPSIKGRKLKIYYAVQVASKPPTFIFYVNNPELFHFSYVRFIENQLRGNFNFEGTPIIIKSRERKERKR